MVQDGPPPARIPLRTTLLPLGLLSGGAVQCWRLQNHLLFGRGHCLPHPWREGPHTLPPACLLIWALHHTATGGSYLGPSCTSHGLTHLSAPTHCWSHTTVIGWYLGDTTGPAVFACTHGWGLQGLPRSVLPGADPYLLPYYTHPTLPRFSHYSAFLTPLFIPSVSGPLHVEIPPLHSPGRQVQVTHLCSCPTLWEDWDTHSLGYPLFLWIDWVPFSQHSDLSRSLFSYTTTRCATLGRFLHMVLTGGCSDFLSQMPESPALPHTYSPTINPDIGLTGLTTGPCTWRMILGGGRVSHLPLSDRRFSL